MIGEWLVGRVGHVLTRVIIGRSNDGVWGMVGRVVIRQSNFAV